MAILCLYTCVAFLPWLYTLVQLGISLVLSQACPIRPGVGREKTHIRTTQVSPLVVEALMSVKQIPTLTLILPVNYWSFITMSYQKLLSCCFMCGILLADTLVCLFPCFLLKIHFTPPFSYQLIPCKEKMKTLYTAGQKSTLLYMEI